MQFLVQVKVVILLLLLVLHTGTAQSADVCSNTPGEGDRVVCEEDADSTDDIEIYIEGIDITTSENSHDGIEINHHGMGKIDIGLAPLIDEEGNFTVSNITTTGYTTNAIVVNHFGQGEIYISTVLGTLTASGGNGGGIVATHRGSSGGIRTESSSDINISDPTPGWGISSIIGTVFNNSGHLAERAPADIDIDYSVGTLTTTGSSFTGIDAHHHHAGNINIDVFGGATVATNSHQAHGIHTTFGGTKDEDGNININIRGRSTVSTRGIAAFPVYATTFNRGDIDVVVDDSTLTSNSRTTSRGQRNNLFSVCYRRLSSWHRRHQRRCA